MPWFDDFQDVLDEATRLAKAQESTPVDWSVVFAGLGETFCVDLSNLEPQDPFRMNVEHHVEEVLGKPLRS